MEKKRKDIVTTAVMGALLFALSAWCIIKPPQAYSQGERRALAQAPRASAESILSGEFMEEFEQYSLDQFPMREGFRTLKALSEYGVFQKADNNGIYLAEGHLSKLEYPLRPAMLKHAAERFEYIYDAYIRGNDMEVYFSIVPDKNMFLAEPNGYLSLDYGALAEYFIEEMDYARYIDITPLLSIEDYYRTDSHWRQERILGVARRLAAGMGTELNAEYAVNRLDSPFYGVYRGQSALPVAPDTVSYLTNEMLDGCTLTSYDSGSPADRPIYDMEAALGRDPYEMFLSGSDALLVLENPGAQSGRELILFRDSFGSSIAPFFAEGYSKVTLVDIRYVQSSMLGQFIDFEDQDVLFLYSAGLLNNSLALK